MNPTMLQSFHWYTEGNGTLYNKLKDMAPWLQDLGITAVWFPPAFKAAGGGYSVGYDPYDLYDLGEFEQKGTVATKYGTKEEYQQACRTLQQHGISVIADIVINHKAGGDEKERFHAVRVDEDNREHDLSEPFEIEAYTKFTFPGRGTQYSDFRWDFNCFSGVDYAEGQEAGIYRIINEHGEGWEEMVDDEKGNYDYLMYNDIEHRNPFVRAELNTWAKWYHDQIFFDGVRLDAVKHQSPQFYKEWLLMLRANTGKNLFAVGEYWAPGQRDLLQKYIDETDGCMSVFDSSLQHKLHEASNAGDQYDLRTIFNDTLTASNPMHSVTVVDNHDTQPLQQLEAPVEQWFKPIAYALILLRENGYPCVFAPDLLGGQYTDKGSDGQDHEIFLNRTDGIEQLLKARKHYAYGEQRDYFNTPTRIGWLRKGDGMGQCCAVVVSNAGQQDLPMELGTNYSGWFFYDYLGRFEHHVQIDENGWGNFTVPAGNVSVWVPVD